MKMTDTLRMAQTNLFRSKLRTTLTIIAIFIGALTISLTNGVSNGAKAYLDDQLGNVGAEDTLIIQAIQDTAPGFGSSEVSEYNPDKTTGAFSMATLSTDDLEKIRQIDGLTNVNPELMPTIDYISAGDKKYTASIQQYPDGMNLELRSGRIVEISADNEVIIPVKYLEPLGFSSANEALNKEVQIGYKDLSGETQELPVKIVGVEQSSLLGAGGWYVSNGVTRTIHDAQTKGVATLENSFMAATAKFPKDYTQEQIDNLKQRVDKAGFSAMTVQDQIGIVNQVIDTIQIALNIFGAIALLAASFGIVNTLLMAVNERTREIGLMKALGTSRRTIFSIFSVEAISLGFWGSLLGVLASMGIGAIVNPIATETFLKDFEGFELLAFPLLPSLGIIGLIMLIAFLAGALPSIKASRLNPIEALRYE
jgi:putative ABC transport system permease protein